MPTFALVKEGCGTHFVFDTGELERHKKLGWTERPADWKEKKLEEDRVRRAEAIKAELARLQAEQVSLEEPPKKKPGRPPKE